MCRSNHPHWSWKEQRIKKPLLDSWYSPAPVIGQALKLVVSVASMRDFWYIDIRFVYSLLYSASASDRPIPNLYLVLTLSLGCRRSKIEEIMFKNCLVDATCEAYALPRHSILGELQVQACGDLSLEVCCFNDVAMKLFISN